MEHRRSTSLFMIKRLLMAVNFLLMALIFYRNIGGNELSGFITQIGALAIFFTFIGGTIYLISGNVGIFTGDGMDVLVVCLFTFGVAVWTLIRGILFIIREWPLAAIFSNMDFAVLVDLYQIPGALLSIWTSWFILRWAMGSPGQQTNNPK